MTTDSLTGLVGTAAAAARLGCSSRTVQRAAKKHGIGTVLCGYRVFSSADIASLAKSVNPHLGRFASRKK